MTMAAPIEMMIVGNQPTLKNWERVAESAGMLLKGGPGREWGLKYNDTILTLLVVAGAPYWEPTIPDEHALFGYSKLPSTNLKPLTRKRQCVSSHGASTMNRSFR
jgi:hypothetical protein